VSYRARYLKEYCNVSEFHDDRACYGQASQASVGNHQWRADVSLRTASKIPAFAIHTCVHPERTLESAARIAVE
jgi:hypothetical protein